jgi:hypothetical protein
MRHQTPRPTGPPRYNYVTRPTVVLPGSRGTIAGTAINDWLDDDGQPIYGGTEVTGHTPADDTRC